MKQFTQDLCVFQKLFLWGDDEGNKVGAILILFSVDYLKDVLIHETNELIKHPMDPVEYIWWIGCWSTWVAGSEFPTGGNGCQHRG